jgi:autotransporter-associated beta strand protein
LSFWEALLVSRTWKLSASRPTSHRRSLRRAQIRLEQLETRLTPSINVLTWNYGSASTGVNPNETQLTPANVKVGQFGKLATVGLDGQAYAQPLVDQAVAIGGVAGDSSANLLVPSGTHNVVFVATEHDSLYAIDTTTYTILWQRSFTNINSSYIGTTVGTNINNTLGATAISTIPNGEVNSADINPEIGITGTPVIDPTSNILYLDVKTKETIGGNVTYVQQIHAINISDGTDKTQPYTVGYTDNLNSAAVGTLNDNHTSIFVYGTGDGSIPDPNTATDGNPGTKIVQFNALREANRPALSIHNGQLYGAWASHGDNGPYHGWVLKWTISGSGLTLAGWFCTSPNNGLSGIWSGGTTLQFEADGTTFYFETGNGSGGTPTLNAQGFPTNANYNEAVVKVAADATTGVNHQGPNGWGMKVADYFIPYNVAALDGADSDFGSGAPLLLPDSAGIPGHPHLMVAAGKEGRIYLIDRDNMGKFDPVNDNVVNAVNDGSGHLRPPNLISGSLSTPAYYNGKIYWTSGYSGPAYSYIIQSSGQVATTSQTTATFGYLPGSMVVSANGNTNGIAWVVDRNLNELHAYDASTFATELWNSAQAAGGADNVGTLNKFAPPLVANGEVFVGTANSLVIYGPTVSPTAPPTPPSSLAATAVSGSSISLTWSDTSNPPNTATGYMIEKSTDGTTFVPITTAPAGTTSISIGGLSLSTKYYFEIIGFNGQGNSAPSNVANATTTSQVVGLDFSSGFSGAGSKLTLNGSTALNGAKLELTNGNVNQAGSAFATTPLDITSFTAQFTFQSSTGTNTAEGITFTIEGFSANALGASGGGLGYGASLTGGSGGINNSVAVKFDLFSDQGEGNDSTGLYVNGAAPTNVGSTTMPANLNLHNGDVFQVTLTYSPGTLTVTLQDANTGASTTANYAVNIPSVVGNGVAYVGFTGSTGTQTATQDILSWTYTPTALVSPNAPTGLGAVPASATSVALSWTPNSSSPAGYHLDRATDSGFTQNLVTETISASSTNSYTDTAIGLAPGGTYYYRLRAYNAAGDSGNSNTATLTIPLAPPKPTLQKITDVSSTEIDMSWQDNAGHQAQGYQILRAVNHGTFSQIVSLPPTSRTAPSQYDWSDTGLTPGDYYEYHIIAFNSSGNNDFAGVNATTITTPPRLLWASPGAGGVTLSWIAPLGAATFNVSRGTTSGGETPLTSGVGASPYTDTTAAGGTTYYYTVTAVNANVSPLPNESAPSNELSSSTASTFVWKGGAGSFTWSTPGNWVGNVAPPGNGSASLVFPSGASTLANTDDLADGSNAFASISFLGASYTVTVNNPLVLGSGGIGAGVTGTETIVAAAGGSITLATSTSLVTASGATLVINAGIANGGNTLGISGNGIATLAGTVSGSGGLTVSGPGTLTLSGASTYTGPTQLIYGANVSGASNTALGNNDVTISTDSTLSVQGSSNLGAGLTGDYYSISGDTLPDARMTSISGITAMIAQYGGGTTANPFGTPIATDTSASPGSTFNYGTGATNSTNTAGFPLAVRTTNGGGASIFGVWTGIFFAPLTGTYIFDTASDDGSALFLDGNLVVSNNLQQAITTRQGTVNLSAGPHQIEIAYENGGGGYGFWADVEIPGINAFQRLPNALLGTSAPTQLQLGSLTGAGTVNLGANGIVVGTDNNSSIFSGTLSSAPITSGLVPSVTKAGSGTLTLAGVDTYTGGTFINSGSLQLGNNVNPLTSISSNAITDNGTLVLVLPNNGTLAYSGVISGSGGVTLSGSGVLQLGAANTYTGPTNIGGATVVDEVANALPARSNLVLGLGSSSGKVDLNGFTQTISGATLSGTGTTNVITNSSATPVILTLAPVAGGVDNVPLTGNLSLVAIGSPSVTLAGPDTYAGNTTVSSGTLVLGGSQALPPTTTITVNGTGTLDLGGYNASVAELTGFGSGTVTDSSITPATLTITGTAAGGIYSGKITGPVSILVNGAGSLTTLAGGTASIFSGGVTAMAGNVAGTPGSFGIAPVTLYGGNVQLVSTAVAGFGGNGTGWTINNNGSGGNAFLASNVLQLTSAANNQATSAFYNVPVQPTGGFTASFVYQMTPNGGPADGVTFVLQNDPRGVSALGAAGGGLGYGGITSSMAIALNIYAGAGGGRGTQLLTGGNITNNINPNGGFNILTSGDPIQVVLSYNVAQQTLVETATDKLTGVSGTANFYGANLANILGGTSAFVGFTGATGGANAQQQVSSFTFLPAAGAATTYANTFQAFPGSVSNVTVLAGSVANAYAIGGLTVPAGATVSMAADLASTANQAYSLAVSGPAMLAGSVGIAKNGTAAGTLIFNGSLNGTGTTIGAITGSGGVNLASTSTYNVVLGGTGAGQYDNLSVGGGVTLSGGNLSVSYGNGFAPAVGQTFTILHAGGPVSGAFAQGGTITSGNATFSISYNASNVVLTVASVVSPTKLVISAPSSATAGTSFSVTVTAQDNGNNTAGGYNGTVTLTSSIGSDISPTSVMLTGGTATFQVTLTTAGSQTITAAAAGLTSALSSSIAVSPGAFSQYLVTLLGPTTIQAGGSFLGSVKATDAYGNAVAGYSGPATVTASISPGTTAGNFPQTVTLNANGAGAFVGSLQAVGRYTVSVGSGSFTGTAASPVTVTAGPAAKLGFAAPPGSTATGVTLPAVTVQVQDAYANPVISDNTDVVTVGIASGPGGFLAGSTTTAVVHNGEATFANLTLVVPGSYTLSAVVPSSYTGPNSSSFTVAPLQVVPGSFAGTPSGFSLTFNAPFLVNSVTPVLFGQGFGAAAPAPSVTVTGPNGPVEGSLVLNTGAHSITFIQTNTASEVNNGTPILPDGSYTVTVRGAAAANGFQALNAGGGYLDGLSSGTPGSDFTATFTVNAGAGLAKSDVVWAPATADGPGQPLVAPGNNVSGGGYPIYLSDTTGAVTSVVATLNYDPTLLTVTGVTGANFTLLASSTPGHAVFQYKGPALPTGTQVPIGAITATVPPGTAGTPTPYKAKDLLHFSGISINGGSTLVVGGDALHLVAYVGDADGNGNYTSNDAVLITRAALQSDSGFVAYPLVDPVIVADTDGSGFIPADAALQVNEDSVGVMPLNLPPLPVNGTTVHFQPIANNVDPTLSVGVRGQGPGVSSDGIVTAEVNLDDAHPEGSTGLTVAHLALTYDPRQFSVSASDIHLGSFLGSGWSVSPTIDAATGAIAIALSSTTPITSAVGGSLVTIDFHSVGRIANLSAIALVNSVNINGRYTVTELEDAQGTFTLSPAAVDRAVITPAPAVIVSPVADVPPAIDSEMVSVSSNAPPMVSLEETFAPTLTPVDSARGIIPEVPAVEPPALSIHGGMSVVGSTASAVSVLNAVPLSGIAVQAVVSAASGFPSLPVLLSAPRLADQYFQSLVRAASEVPGAWVLLSPTPGENLDGLNWDAFTLDWQDSLITRAPSREAQTPPPPHRADQAVVDQVFAQAADEPADLIPLED